MSLSLSFSESGTEDKDLGAVIYFGGGPMKKWENGRHETGKEEKLI